MALDAHLQLWFSFLTTHIDNDRVIEEMVTNSPMKQTLSCVNIEKKMDFFFSLRLYED